MTPGLSLLVALLSAALMGMAIQRGATCMVAAVNDAVKEGKFGRTIALGEAAIWVGGLLAIVQLAGLDIGTHAGFSVNALTLAGGVLLGLGAWINRACLFGSVARIGNGQWAWLATPVGFYLGCLAMPDRPAPLSLAAGIGFPVIIAAIFMALVAFHSLRLRRASSLLDYLWHPHRATLLIGVTFVSTMLTAGMWAYSDALDALARNSSAMDLHLVLRSVMALALFSGAVIGGRIAGVAGREWPRPATIARCLAGGALMGLGSTLVPGGNDGLILHGLPFLLPHAWVAVALMMITIAIAIKAAGFLCGFQARLSGQ